MAGTVAVVNICRWPSASARATSWLREALTCSTQGATWLRRNAPVHFYESEYCDPFWAVTKVIGTLCLILRRLKSVSRVSRYS